MKLARTTAPRSLSLIFVLFTVACSVAQTGRGYSPQSDQGSSPESPEIIFERWQNFPSVDITWRDGDRLQGRLIEWRSGMLQIQSNVFRHPISVDVDLLDSIRLASASDQANSNAGAASESPQAKVNIVLVDGSQLTGNIVEFDEQKVRFQDLRFGEITLPLLQVSSIAPAYDNLYAWSGNFDSWQGETTGPQAQWQVEEGNLKTSHADAQLWLPLSLNQSFSIEFAVQAEAPLDFVLATGLDAEKSLRLSRIGDSWILGTADDFEIIDALDPSTKKMQLRFEWDSAKNTLSVREDNQLIKSILDPEAKSLRTGILVSNQGKSLTLTQLRVISLDGLTSPELPEISRPVVQPSFGSKNMLQWSDGSVLWCDVESIENARIQLRIAATDQVLTSSTKNLRIIRPKTVSGSAARPKFNLAEVPHLLKYGQQRMTGRYVLNAPDRQVTWHSAKLAQSAIVDHHRAIHLKANALGTKEAPQSYRQLSDVASLNGGDRIPCNFVRASSAVAWLQTPFASDPIRTPLKQILSIEFFWQFKNQPKFTDESRLMLLSIPRNLEEDVYTHALIGKNGDLLRGNLISVNSDKIEIDSKFVPMVLNRWDISYLVSLSSGSDKDLAAPDPKETKQAAADAQSSGNSIGQFGPRSADIKPETESTERPQVQIQLPGEFLISGRWLGGTSDTIHLENDSLGICKIPYDEVTGLALGAQLPSEDQGYFAWNMKRAISPRWKAAAESAGKAAAELVGTPAPSLELSDLSGQTFRLSDHAGKVVVLDFWATWCGPCVAALPEYRRVTALFPDTEVMFLGVNSTETPETVRDFLDTKKWNGFSTLFDFESQAARLFRVQGIPHTVVIGPDGMIRHIHVGYTASAAEKLKQEIQQLLN